jgi:hypothetical protein
MTSRWLKMIGVMVIACGLVHAAPSSASDDQARSGNPTVAAGNHSLDAAHKNQIGLGLSGPTPKTYIHRKPANVRVLPIGTRKNLRLRGPGPAIIGGGPSSKAKTTASITGTGMNRKW